MLAPFQGSQGSGGREPCQRTSNPEYAQIRLQAGRPKADQTRETGAAVVAASCDSCRIQLGDVSKHYHLGTRVVGLTELAVRALVPKRNRRPTPALSNAC